LTDCHASFFKTTNEQLGILKANYGCKNRRINNFLIVILRIY